MESNRVWIDVVGEEEVNYVSALEEDLPATPPALQHEAFIISINHQLIHRIFILPFIRVILCIDRAASSQEMTLGCAVCRIKEETNMVEMGKNRMHRRHDWH
jgi:hypothetical protein